MSTSNRSERRPAVHGTDGRAALGIAAALASAFFLASMDAIVFNLRPSYGVIDTQLYRYVASMIVLVLFMASTRKSFAVNFPGAGLTALRGVGIVLIGLLFFTSFKVLDQGTATALVNIAPIILTIVAALFFKEPAGPWRWGAVLVGFVGVTLIQVALWMAHGEGWTPLGGGDQPVWLLALYMMLPVLAAIFFAFVMMSVRMVPPGTSTLSITWVYSLGALASVIVLSLFFGSREPINWQAHWWQFVLLAVTTFGASQSLNIAYRSAPGAVVSSLGYSGILWAVGFGFFTQGLIPPVGIWFGVTLIVVAGIITAWREGRVKSEEPKPTSD